VVILAQLIVVVLAFISAAAHPLAIFPVGSYPEPKVVVAFIVRLSASIDIHSVLAFILAITFVQVTGVKFN